MLAPSSSADLEAPPSASPEESSMPAHAADADPDLGGDDDRSVSPCPCLSRSSLQQKERCVHAGEDRSAIKRVVDDAKEERIQRM